MGWLRLDLGPGDLWSRDRTQENELGGDTRGSHMAPEIESGGRPRATAPEDHEVGPRAPHPFRSLPVSFLSPSLSIINAQKFLQE